MLHAKETGMRSGFLGPLARVHLTFYLYCADRLSQIRGLVSSVAQASKALLSVKKNCTTTALQNVLQKIILPKVSGKTAVYL